jgi:hypothetical protein
MMRNQPFGAMVSDVTNNQYKVATIDRMRQNVLQIYRYSSLHEMMISDETNVLQIYRYTIVVYMR